MYIYIYITIYIYICVFYILYFFNIYCKYIYIHTCAYTQHDATTCNVPSECFSSAKNTTGAQTGMGSRITQSRHRKTMAGTKKKSQHQHSNLRTSILITTYVYYYNTYYGIVFNKYSPIMWGN
jgi:hypothetical protein